MSDDTQHTPNESVRASQTSVGKLLNVTVTIDDGEIVQTLTFKVKEHKFEIGTHTNTDVEGGFDSAWQKMLKPGKTVVSLGMTARKLEVDDDGTYLVVSNK